jgi:hypothetical protein
MSSFNNHKFRKEESFLHGVLKTFYDDNTLSLFKNIAVANGKKDIILSNIKLTSQQYYSRMSALTKAGLVKKGRTEKDGDTILQHLAKLFMMLYR